MPQSRKEEFASVCRLIQKKTVENICNLLSDNDKKLATRGTCANREFIFKKDRDTNFGVQLFIALQF
jgi:hypothetical protein